MHWQWINKLVTDFIKTEMSFRLHLSGICFIVFILFIFYLVLSTPWYCLKPCMPHNIPNHYEYDVMCHDVLTGRFDAIAHVSSYAWCHRNDIITDEQYLKRTQDCKKFLKNLHYNEYIVTEEEKNFPLAFSILTHENLEQTERWEILISIVIFLIR